jgi:hypothetical protein
LFNISLPFSTADSVIALLLLSLKISTLGQAILQGKTTSVWIGGQNYPERWKASDIANLSLDIHILWKIRGCCIDLSE